MGELGQMGPRIPMDNARHSRSWYAVHSSEVSKGHAGLRELRAPGDDLLIGVDGRRVILANSAVAGGRLAALLIVAILDIIGVVAKPKMGRIYAKAVSCVANRVALIAAMAHEPAFGDGAVMEFVGKARRCYGDSFAISYNVQLPVPLVVGASSPEPTVVRAALINLFPKSVFVWAKYPYFVVMTNDKAHGAIGYVSALFVGLIRNWSNTVASALAHAVLGKQPASGNPRGVVLKIGRKVRCDAVNLWLLIVGFWSTILHTSSPFLTICHAAGLFQQSLRFRYWFRAIV